MSMFRERIMAMRCGYFCALAGLLLLVACVSTWYFRTSNVMPDLLEKHGEQAFTPAIGNNCPGESSSRAIEVSATCYRASAICRSERLSRKGRGRNGRACGDGG